MAAFRAKHARRRRLRPRLLIPGAVIAVVAAGAVVALLLAGNGSKGKSPAQVAAGHIDTTTVPISMTIQPPNGAVDQPLNTKVAVSASTGRLMSVMVAGPDGKAIAGAIDTTGQSWLSTDPLAPHTQYTVAATASMPSGRSFEKTLDIHHARTQDDPRADDLPQRRPDRRSRACRSNCASITPSSTRPPLSPPST